MERIFRFIDIYPDLSTYIIVVVATMLQFLIGNYLAPVLAISFMLPTLIVTLPTNVVMKRTFKVRRPKRYYESVKVKTVFEGSFPSFHSQFSAGEATAYITGIALYSPENIRFKALILALIIAGLSSVVIAYSRVALGLHHPADAFGGFIFGVFTGFAVPYALRFAWIKIPLILHLLMIAIFVLTVFFLSSKQRRIRN